MTGKNLLLTSFKILISITLLGVLFIEAIDTGAAEVLFNIDLGYFFVAYLAHLIAFIILLVRWKTVLGIFHDVPIRALFRSFYIGIFSNNFLPSNVGGDLLRASYLANQGLSTANILISTVLDRFIGALVTLLICSVAFYWVPLEQIKSILNPKQLLLFLLLLISLPVIIYFLFKVLNRKFNLLRRHDAFAYIMQVFNIFRKHTKRIFFMMSLGFISTSFVVCSYWLLAGGLNMNIPMVILYLAVPLSFIAGLLPISIGGLGVREGTVIYLLTIFDQPREQVITLTLAYLLILIIVTLPGGLLILMKNKLIVR